MSWPFIYSIHTPDRLDSRSPGVFLLYLSNRLCFVLLVLACAGVFTPALATESHLERRLSVDDAIHLLNRTGLGAHRAEVMRYTGKTRRAAVASVLGGFSDEANQRMPGWIDTALPLMFRGGLLPAARQQFNQARNREYRELRNWWVDEMLTTSTPQTERLVLFWHNHFVTTYKGLGNMTTALARQNRVFREHAAGNFRSLLHAMIEDPAMLRYLDNNTNRKNAPNENLARELFELFTLGEGNYSEQDIKEAARALTGHTYAVAHNLKFRVIQGQHDFGEKTIFGSKDKFDGNSLVELILEQDETAEFIADKFWRHYVAENTVDDLLVTQWAQTFRESDYEISVLLETLLESDAFWAEENRLSIIKSPVDLVVGSLRTLGQQSHQSENLIGYMDEQGQGLFDAPNVAGWPGGDAWITPGRLLMRLQWLDHMDNNRNSGNSGQPNQMSAASPQSSKKQTMSGVSDDQDHAMDEAAGRSDGIANGETFKHAKNIRVQNVFVSRLKNPLFDKNTNNQIANSPKRAEILFQLGGLSFHGREWDNWMFRLIQEHDGATRLIVNRYDCWPDCLSDWPECAQRTRHDSYSRQVQISLLPAEPAGSKAKNRHCSLEQLSTSDRQLLAGLIGNLHTIHEFAKNDSRLRNPVKRATYNAWLPILAALARESQDQQQMDIVRAVSSADEPMQVRDDDVRITSNTMETGTLTSESGDVQKSAASPRIPEYMRRALAGGFKGKLSVTAGVHFAIDGQQSFRHPNYQLR